MKVRLGFGVITQLPHPILLVDEALAVGDAAFKRKCQAVIANLLEQGRTLVFVSHSEGDLKKYCKRGIFLDAGTLETDGTVEEALAAYKAAEKRDADAKAEKKKREQEAKAAAERAAAPAPVPGAVEAAT